MYKISKKSFITSKVIISIAICFLYNMCSFLSFAMEWHVQNGLLNKKEIKILKQKYPTLENEKQAYELLKDISNNNKFLKLEIQKYDNYWLITGEKAQPIIQIKFKTDMLMVQSHLQILANSYINLVDSEQLRNNLTQRIKKELEDLGFPKADINLKIKHLSRGARYTYHIKLNSPCLWAKVNLKFKLPPNFDFKVKEGDICNKFKIEEAINQLKTELTQRGYIRHNFNPPFIIYDDNLNIGYLTIEGNSGYQVKYTIKDNDKTLDIFALFVNQETTMNQLEDDPQSVKLMLEEKYKNLGYDDVIIEGPEKKIGRNIVEYIFTVNKGKQYKLTDIKFNGNLSYTEQELLQIMNLSTVWKIFPTLNIIKIKDSIENLKNFYYSKGYWDIQISDPIISKNPTDNTAQILINIKEGQRRLLDSITVEGNGWFKTDEILALFTKKKYDPLTSSDLLEFEKAIKLLYSNNGFLNVNINYDLKFQKQGNNLLTSVKTKITEGTRTKIATIKVIGLTTTDIKVVLRELSFAEGSWYSPQKIENSRRALLNLGIFKNVVITTTPAEESVFKENEINVIITVQEADPINVSFGPGWSLYKGARFGIEGSYKNIAGTGRQIFSQISISEEANQKPIGSSTLVGRSFSIGYIEPYIFDLPFNGSLSFSNIAKADEQWSISYIFESALSHRFKSFWKGGMLTLFYSQKFNIEIGAPEQQEGYLYLIGGNTRTGKIGARYNIDKRNDMAWPSDGYILSMEASNADFNLGGTIVYQSYSISGSSYVEIINRLVFAVGLSVASYQNIKRINQTVADILPVSESIHIGGADSIRGFKDRSLGPVVQYDVFDDEGKKITRVKSDVIGGSQSAIYKIELRYQILPPSLGLSTFIDGGNVFFSKKEISSYNKKELEYNEKYNSKISDPQNRRSPSSIIDNEEYSLMDIIKRPKNLWYKNYFSYGLSLNYLTPIGSINLAYGLPWKRCPTKSSDSCIPRGRKTKHWYLDGELHFNIGATF